MTDETSDCDGAGMDELVRRLLREAIEGVAGLPRPEAARRLAIASGAFNGLSLCLKATAGAVAFGLDPARALPGIDTLTGCTHRRAER